MIIARLRRIRPREKSLDHYTPTTSTIQSSERGRVVGRRRSSFNRHPEWMGFSGIVQVILGSSRPRSPRLAAWWGFQIIATVSIFFHAPAIIAVHCRPRAPALFRYNQKGRFPSIQGDSHALGTQILLDVKLRTASRQFDGEAAQRIQTEDRRP